MGNLELPPIQVTVDAKTFRSISARGCPYGFRIVTPEGASYPVEWIVRAAPAKEPAYARP